jgi:hypothetical protein
VNLRVIRLQVLIEDVEEHLGGRFRIPRQVVLLGLPSDWIKWVKQLANKVINASLDIEPQARLE